MRDEDEIRHRALARLELASDLHRELEDVIERSVRAAKRTGATWHQLQVATGLSLGRLRRMVARR